MSAHNPNFNEDHIPLAYLITFRCYGTWLHGDERGSVDRYHNRYGASFIPPSERWRQYNEQLLKHPPVELDAERRAAVDAAVRETCEKRNWLLRAINVRTNHAHNRRHSKGQAGSRLERFQGQRYAEDERGEVLASRAQSVGGPRQQTLFVDGAPR